MATEMTDRWLSCSSRVVWEGVYTGYTHTHTPFTILHIQVVQTVKIATVQQHLQSILVSAPPPRPPFFLSHTLHRFNLAIQPTLKHLMQHLVDIFRTSGLWEQRRGAATVGDRVTGGGWGCCLPFVLYCQSEQTPSFDFIICKRHCSDSASCKHGACFLFCFLLN